MKLPRLKINKKGQMTDINGKKVNFEVKKQVTLRQSTYPEKIFVVQELQFNDGGNEIRVGYYIVGKKPRVRGKWVWGQFCPLFPRQDLVKLIKKAKTAGII